MPNGMLSGFQGWEHESATEPQDHIWFRGGKFYAVQLRRHNWKNKNGKRTRTQETVMGRIMTLDRNKYLPDGSSNPNCVGNQ